MRGLIVGISVSVLTTLLSALGFFHNWENQIFDFLIWWEQDRRSASILLVDIDDRDYRELFHSASPLSRRKLSEIVLKIAHAGPRAICVDVDFADPTPEDHYFLEALERLRVQQIPAVIPLSLEMKEEIPGMKGLNKRESLAFPLPENVLVGAAEFPISREGVIREMQLLVRLDSGAIYPSVPLAAVAASEGYRWATLSEALGEPADKHSPAKGLRDKTNILITDAHHNPFQKIQYIGAKQSFGVLRTSLLDAMPDQFFGKDSVFFNKIVVVGGTFKVSRDFYATPKGMMSGMEIIANSIETLLNAKRLKPLNHALELLFEILMVLVMTGVFVKLAPLKATAVCLVSILPLALAGSALAFMRLSYWVNFIPTAVSIFIHGEFSFFEHYAHLKARVEHLASALAYRDRELSEMREKLRARDETSAVRAWEEKS
jgi:CHASE2 domain-containing sensor protein